jgi:hypothetical protein
MIIFRVQWLKIVLFSIVLFQGVRASPTLEG